MAFGRKQWLMVSLILFFVLGKFVGGEQQVPCHFIFGDSKDDNGNNNVLLTIAKTNYPRYGIDFPTRTTGRFTNGELLGFTSFIQPFATANSEDILRGLNYASGAVSPPRDNDQETSCATKKCNIYRRAPRQVHYAVAVGINNYINNYLMPTYPARYVYQTSMQKFEARKVAVFGVGNPDCKPADIAANASSCAKNAAEPFNQRLKPLVLTTSIIV
ncbi:hypothetical protein RJ639_014616 [Escallonia herrerae]|uniref:GDSL esterase/lipase n=1 Tax=Escallonia herrerae TaxID=1293975 RepID=A0AA88VHN9_9ASTE|nr:hypothetical protein RJ639_014616 [Escallonia herrerae]